MAVTLPLLRPMVGADVDAVLVLEQEVFSDPWSLEAFHEELSAPNRVYLVLEEGGAVAGYGGVMMVGEDAHVMTLGVAEARRRRQLATRLLLGLIEEAIASGARHLTLEVRLSNDPAIGLYEKFGFSRVGRRPRYYRDEDAIIMWAVDVAGPGYNSRLERIREGL